MQRLITSVLIVIFVGFAVFGLSFMAHQDATAHGGCLAGGAFGAACPQDIGAFSMIDLHFSALSQFSSATFSGLPAADTMVLFGLLVALVVGVGRYGASDIGAVVIRCRRSFDLLHFTYRQQLTGWLAVHNRKNPSPIRVFSF